MTPDIALTEDYASLAPALLRQLFKQFSWQFGLADDGPQRSLRHFLVIRDGNGNGAILSSCLKKPLFHVNVASMSADFFISV